MNGNPLSSLLTLTEFASCVIALIFVCKRDCESQYKLLRLFLAVKTSAYLFLVPLALFGGHLIEKQLAYRLYFDLYWTDFAVEAAIGLAVIWDLFNLVMSPLSGMRDLGKIVFKWAAAISLVMAAAVVSVPNPYGFSYITHVLTLLQRAQGILTLSLLFFVCSAIQPLGLKPRGRTFGVILSLSIVAVFTLFSSGWLAYSKEMYSLIDNFKSLSASLSLLVCAAYFIIPEPKREMVILPTTSPYFRWNRVAEALGDPPGFVAIAGVPPDMFAPAEIEVMKRASRMMVPPVFPLTSRLEEPQSQSQSA